MLWLFKINYCGFRRFLIRGNSSYVQVITQATVLCLIYMHDARGRAAPEGKCVYIRQSVSACVITYMLHFQH